PRSLHRLSRRKDDAAAICAARGSRLSHFAGRARALDRSGGLSVADAVFPDNTVLCNFAALGRLDLLEGFLRGRGRWTDAVAYEAERSGKYAYPKLATVAEAGWLHEPVEVVGDDANDHVEHLRRDVFGGDPDVPTMHLGEAQTCYL